MRICEVENYKGEHEAPTSADHAAPLYDLTINGIYPADVYTKTQDYAHDEGDYPAFSIALVNHNKPNALITIYRAVPHQLSKDEQLYTLEKAMAEFLRRGKVPTDTTLSGSAWYNWAHEEKERLQNLPDVPAVKMSINHGDWVAIDRGYAVEHGRDNLLNKYKIITKKVRAKQLWTYGDSIREWGYDATV